MLEPKRVDIKPVQQNQKEKKVRKSKTLRFVLALGESNPTTCPEFSFADLLKNEKQRNGTSNLDEEDPFVEEDSDVALIAQKFEEKYGPKAFKSGKKKRTRDMDDYFDLGDGYDEDDPFIDNTEAYDEVVPSTLTTRHGGFYINQGKLDFRPTVEDSLSADGIASPQVKKKKKRVLDSDSEEETGEALAKKLNALRKKKKKELREGEKKKRKLLAGKEGETVVKKKKKKDAETVKKSIAAVPNSSVSGSGQKDAAPTSEAAPSVTAVSTSPVTTTTTTVTVTTTSVNGVVEHTKTAKTEAGSKPTVSVAEEPSSAAPQVATGEDSSSRSGEEEKNSQLPSNLPTELANSIDSIKKEAKESKDEKKSKFFSDTVNKLLLDIELGSRNLAWGNRTAIYNHLGEYLPCGKQALLRRAKKLRESQQDDQLRIPLKMLKEAIQKVMPGLEEEREAQVAKAQLEAKEDASEALKEEGSTESEGEEKEKDNSKKKATIPRRKFKWTGEIRELFMNVVTAKMKLVNAFKSRNQSLEDYMKLYLESEIKPLWPNGWMQTRTLFKESKAVLDDTPKNKPKKPTVTKVASPVPELNSVQENSAHVSKTEDVIEISSIQDSDNDEKLDVVVNLPGSEVKAVSSQSLPASSSVVSLLSCAMKHGVKSTSAAVTTTFSSTIASVSSQAQDTGVKPIDISQVKRVTPVPVIEIPDSPDVPVLSPSQRLMGSFPKGQRLHFSPKDMSSPNVVSNSPSNSNKSFQETGFSGKITAQQPQQQVKPGQSLQQQRAGSPQFKAHASSQQKMLASQQIISTLQQKLPASQQAKMSSPKQHLQQQPPQLKPSSVPQQQKQTQERRNPSVQQRSLTSSSSSSSILASVSANSGSLKEQPNSSWSNVNSLFPSSRSINPVVAVSRIPITCSSSIPRQSSMTTSKTSSSLDVKSPVLFAQQSGSKKAAQPWSTLPPANQKPQNPSSRAPSSPQTQVAMSASTQEGSPRLSSHLLSFQKLQKASLSEAGSASSWPLKTPASNLPPAVSGTSHLKSGIVIGTSNAGGSQKFTPQPPQFKSGIVLGTSTSHPLSLQLPKDSVKSSSLSRQQQQQKQSLLQHPGSITSVRPQGPARRPNKPVPVGMAQRVSPASGSSSTGLLPSSAVTSSRGSTPSPQKSPLSPEDAALSLYEQIQSQIRNQDEMENQAIKNLAMALQMGSTLPGTKPASGGKVDLTPPPPPPPHPPHLVSKHSQQEQIKNFSAVTSLSQPSRSSGEERSKSETFVDKEGVRKAPKMYPMSTPAGSEQGEKRLWQTSAGSLGWSKDRADLGSSPLGPKVEGHSKGSPGHYGKGKSSDEVQSQKGSAPLHQKIVGSQKNIFTELEKTQAGREPSLKTTIEPLKKELDSHPSKHSTSSSLSSAQTSLHSGFTDSFLKFAAQFMHANPDFQSSLEFQPSVRNPTAGRVQSSRQTTGSDSRQSSNLQSLGKRSPPRNEREKS